MDESIASSHVAMTPEEKQQNDHTLARAKVKDIDVHPRDAMAALAKQVAEQDTELADLRARIEAMEAKK